MAARFDVDHGQAALALLAAWGVQVIAFGALQERLRRGIDATGAWVAGMGVRTALLLLVLATALLDAVPREPAVVFGLGLAMLIILEAVWLAPSGAGGGPNDR